MTTLEHLEIVLRETQPLRYPRGKRLPLYLWPLRGTPPLNDHDLSDALRELDIRGISLLAQWSIGEQQEASLAASLRLGRIQRDLGLAIGADCVAPLYPFYNGDPATAHVDAAGIHFFDDSFGKNIPMGCPFTLEPRYAVIRGQVESFAQAYHQASLPFGFAFSDWEVDGPLEWNDAWEHSKRCARCRVEVPDIADFGKFQARLRQLRGQMQRTCYAEPLLSRFPQALVGNYAVYPHNGNRYWYDYFERFNSDLPHQFDQREPQRPWGEEFSFTGYTFAMPVMYTWYRTYDWYDYSPDYRWFYNMLKVASNVGSSAPANLPIISFVHHTLTDPPATGPGHVVAMSDRAYRELLWHSLLRRHSTFFLWCPDNEVAHEVGLLHQVWAEALQYSAFLDEGESISFAVPREEGTVVSGLRLGGQVLVRRSDFSDAREPMSIQVAGQPLRVTAQGDTCQILTL